MKRGGKKATREKYEGWSMKQGRERRWEERDREKEGKGE